MPQVQTPMHQQVRVLNRTRKMVERRIAEYREYLRACAREGITDKWVREETIAADEASLAEVTRELTNLRRALATLH